MDIERRVQVVIDGRTIYDEQVDSREIAFSNRDGRIVLSAGPGSLLGILSQTAVREPRW